MRALFRTDGLRGGGRLSLRPESRLLLTLAASISSLALDETPPLGLLLSFSLLYAVMECRLRLIAMAYAFLSLLCGICLLFVYLLGFFFEPLRSVPLSMATNPFLRLAISVNVILPLALNVRLTDLAAALGRARLPGIIRLPLIVTIRFIPTILNDLMRLNEAVGIRFRGRRGILFWLAHPLTWWRVFFQPLVVGLIRSADDLAMAAELKGLEPGTRFGDGAAGFSADDRRLLALASFALAAACAAEMALKNIA
jgi:energy-coupling factor transport system permease protein